MDFRWIFASEVDALRAENERLRRLLESEEPRRREASRVSVARGSVARKGSLDARERLKDLQRPFSKAF